MNKESGKMNSLLLYCLCLKGDKTKIKTPDSFDGRGRKAETKDEFDFTVFERREKKDE